MSDNKETVEIPMELAFRICNALIDCTDELGALWQIKYANVQDSKDRRIRRRMERDSQVRDAAIKPMLDLTYLLAEHGWDYDEGTQEGLKNG
ncbi:hypothetical protein [Ruegeria atlantica]|uniref:hypothetical protein n=1 Tax=Ruegeria atlantica TaxID=81569 RepID=UPI00147F9E26|nr:hypothetical protein [Ruegeria atlantica]